MVKNRARRVIAWNFIALLVAVLSLSLASCSPTEVVDADRTSIEVVRTSEKEEQADPNMESETTGTFKDDLEDQSKMRDIKAEGAAFQALLSEEEIAYIESFKNRGELIAAARVYGAIFRYDENGHPEGFHYSLLELLTEYLDVPLEMNIVYFADYFKKDGVIPLDVRTDENIVYSPDIFESVDLVCDNLTIRPWREKLMNFVEVIPVSIVVITHDDYVVEDIEELRGLRVAVEPNTSFNQTIAELNRDLDLQLDFTYVNGSAVAMEYLLDDIVDFTLLDSNAALFEAHKEPRLNVSMAISEPEYVGWAVPKENLILKGILDKYIAYTIENGRFDQLWEKEYGVPLRIYSELLGVMDYNRR